MLVFGTELFINTQSEKDMREHLSWSPDIYRITAPYKIWVIDNFLTAEALQKIKLDWPDSSDSRWFRGYQKIGDQENLLEIKRRAISQIDHLPDFVKKFMMFFHSKQGADFIGVLTGLENLIPDETFYWSGIRINDPGSHQLIHSDACRHPKNGLRKELTVLLYLNENYDKARDGGCLEIWDDQMKNRTHEIEPISNRLVIFCCSNTSYHGVPVCNTERRFITFSVMSNEPAGDRTKALFVPRPEDCEQVRELGIKRSK